MAKDNDALPKISKTVTIEAVQQPGANLVFANHSLVQVTPTEVVLSFFQIPLPFAGSQAEMDKVDRVQAYCIGRIVVTPEHAETFAGILNQSLQNRRGFQEKKGKK